MATAAGRNRCITCGKDKATLRCGGCLQEFCFNHLADHRQELNKQLDDVEVNRDLFRQTLTEQTNDLQKHPSIQQIDKWERDSIIKIRQTAEEERQKFCKHTNKNIEEIEIKLNKLTIHLRESREENDFYETDLRHWNEELTQLAEQLNKPLNINLRQDNTPYINKISVNIMPLLPCSTNNDANVKWLQNGVSIAGGNGYGNGVNQLASPFGLYVDDDETVYIADYSNHRIVSWKRGATSGQVVAGGNGQGNRNDQLNNPKDVIIDKERTSLIICDFGNKRVMRWPCRNGTGGEVIISDVNCYGLAMDNNAYLYVSDCNEHEVRRWKIGDTSGTVVAGGNGQGNRLDQLNSPNYIFVDQDHSVYVSEKNNHRVTKWMKGAKAGVVAAGGQGAGSGLTQLCNPYGMVVDQMGVVYVADYDNYRVMCWTKGATQGTIVVGGNAQGRGANQLNKPVGLTFDRQGKMYVADLNNHRVQKFTIDPRLNT